MIVYGQPLHVARVVCAAALQGHDMINLPAGARTFLAAGRRTVLIPPEPPHLVRVPRLRHHREKQQKNQRQNG